MRGQSPLPQRRLFSHHFATLTASVIGGTLARVMRANILARTRRMNSDFTVQFVIYSNF